MALVQAKQIKKWLDAYVPLDNVATDIATDPTLLDVTTVLETALTTAGDLGQAVPSQVGTPSTQIGVRADADHNKVEIFSHATGKKINDGTGNEVYGRLTEAAGVYTVNFYSRQSGVETAFSFGADTNIDIEFLYLFDFNRCPANTSFHVRRWYDDLGNSSGLLITEILTPTGSNMLPDIGYLPVSVSNLKLYVNHIVEDSLGMSPSFTLATKTITWSEANAGYELDTTDKVTAEYTTVEI